MANEFFTNEHTSVLQELVREIQNDPTTYLGSKYMPSIAIPTRKIRNEVIEASGGLTNEHVTGADPKLIQRAGSRVQEFQGGQYKEGILFDESDILYLRELGQNDPSRQGIRQHLDLAVDRLNRRLEARIEYQRWQAIFTGGFTYLGETFAYGVPATNRSVPVGALWSTDGINANNTANPIDDLRYWWQGGYAPYRKYNATGIVMSANTARWILENANTKAYLTSYAANPMMQEYDINKVLSFLIPGLPPITVYKGWFQSETVVNGKLTVSDAVYFVPDGYIFFETSLPGNDMIGDVVLGSHLASGSMESPGFGKFLVVEENIAPGTRGGPANPYVTAWGGFYGAPRMKRPFDVLTAKVIA